MAHTYVVSGILHSGDAATVNGSVDGVPAVVSCNYSAITQQPNAIAFQNFIAPLLLNAAFPPQPSTDNTHNGTFTQ